jgi:hypothetical protein
MPDWQKLVSRRLRNLALSEADRKEVFTELASHLQESYESLRAEGLAEQAAINRALSQVADWDKLRLQIQSARQKGNAMTLRVNRLWLPSLVTLIVSVILLPLLESLGLNPQFFLLIGHHDRTYGLTVYTVWLVTLPLVGALGAYLSTRAGGTRSAILVSGIFPALAFSVVLLFALPYMAFLEHGLETNARSVFHAWTSEFGRLGVVAGWVLVPGACLLIGVLVFQALANFRVKVAG